MIKGKIVSIYLHRLVMGNPKKKEVDHKKGNLLDARKSQLRICSHHQNLSNGKFRINNTSGFTGVTKNKNGGWDTKIWVKGKGIYGGHFKEKEKAAACYRRLSLKYHGRFSGLNRQSKDNRRHDKND